MTETTMIPIFGKENAYYGSETNFQISTKQILSAKYPQLLAIHAANERKSNIRMIKGRPVPTTGKKLKDMGVMAGVSDWLIFESNDTYKGIAIELKTGYIRNGKKAGYNLPSDEQIAFLEKLQLRGWFVAVVYNIDCFIKIIDLYLSNNQITNE